MSRVLVTGGSGFIGSYVVDHLEARGDEPVVLDRLARKGDHSVALGDVRDQSSVDSAVALSEGVIHLAGVLGTQETIDAAQYPASVNVLGTLNVLQAAKRYGVPMVYIAVGNYWMNNPYSISKHTAERFCLMHRKEFGQSVSVVRALNAYGPRQKSHPVRKIIPTFINLALEDKPITVYGDGKQVMDMVHVRDVARALVTALDEQPEEVVEIGTGRPTTVNEIAETVIETVGRGSLTHLPMRPGEDEGSVVLADTNTLKHLNISTAELITLEEGLPETAAYFESLRAVA